MYFLCVLFCIHEAQLQFTKFSCNLSVQAHLGIVCRLWKMATLQVACTWWSQKMPTASCRCGATRDTIQVAGRLSRGGWTDLSTFSGTGTHIRCNNFTPNQRLYSLKRKWWLVLGVLTPTRCEQLMNRFLLGFWNYGSPQWYLLQSQLCDLMGPTKFSCEMT